MKTSVKFIASLSLVGLSFFTTSVAYSQNATSQKQAEHATHVRQAVFSLLGANMGALGAMAKGKIEMDAKVVETNSKRINQLSKMIEDYTKVNTSSFKVKTEALSLIWKKRADFTQKITNLTNASEKLNQIALKGNNSDIKKAIAEVGNSCGGCHDTYKKD